MDMGWDSMGSRCGPSEKAGDAGPRPRQEALVMSRGRVPRRCGGGRHGRGEDGVRLLAGPDEVVLLSREPLDLGVVVQLAHPGLEPAVGGVENLHALDGDGAVVTLRQPRRGGEDEDEQHRDESDSGGQQSEPVQQAFHRATLLASASPPGNAAASPRSSSILRSWLYLATRSERAGAPVLIWPQLVATARSATVVSSVSPDRCDITHAYAAWAATSTVSSVSVSEPIWLGLIRIALATPESIPRSRPRRPRRSTGHARATGPSARGRSRRPNAEPPRRTPRQRAPA